MFPDAVVAVCMAQSKSVLQISMKLPFVNPYFYLLKMILIVQSCMTLTDMRLAEFMSLTGKSAMTKLFI